MPREYEHYNATVIDGINNRGGPIRATLNIPRRYPAADTFGLKLRAGRVGDRLVLMWIADENVTCHCGRELTKVARTSKPRMYPHVRNARFVRCTLRDLTTAHSQLMRSAPARHYVWNDLK